MRVDSPRTPFLLVAFASAFLVLALSPHILLLHTDLGWHIRSGDLIRENGLIPETDPWSYTASGYRWLNISWAWDVAASILHQNGGLKLLVLAGAVVGALIFIQLCRSILDKKAGFLPLLLTLLPLGWCLVTYSLPDVPVSVSPQTITLLLAITFQRTCQRLLRDPLQLRLTSLWPIPAMMLLWVNVHGGFLVGFAILSCFLVEALFRNNQGQIIRVGIGLVAALAVTPMNPVGFEIWEAVSRTLAHGSQSYITEWQPYVFGEDILSALYLILYFVICNPLSNTTPLSERMLALMFLIAGLAQQRNFSLFLLFSAPMFAQQVTRYLEQSFRRLRTRLDRLHLLDQSLLVGSPVSLAFALIFTFGTVLASPYLIDRTSPLGVSFPAHVFPQKEIEFLQNHFPRKHLFNDWNFGSHIIYLTKGALPVFIDGRAGTAYPPQLFQDYNEFIQFRNWDHLFEKYGIEVVLLRKEPPIIDAFFEYHPLWRKVYAGDVANIYLREETNY